MAAGPANVIVCDDHQLVRQTVAAVLEKEGYVVLGVGSSGECLREVTRIRPDLVVMDLRLGDGSGLTTIDEIRSDPELDGIRILLLSGEPLEGVSDLREKTKADAYLSKPFEILEFVETVRSLVDGAGDQVK